MEFVETLTGRTTKLEVDATDSVILASEQLAKSPHTA